MIRRAYDRWAAAIRPAETASLSRFAIEVMGRDQGTLRRVFRGLHELPATARRQLAIYVGDERYVDGLKPQGRTRFLNLEKKAKGRR